MTTQEMTKATLGYQEHFNKVDFEVVHEGPSCDCGRIFAYLGFKRGGSYRAFMVCWNCNTAEEF